MHKSEFPRKFGLHSGVYIARGPDGTYAYVMVGSAFYNEPLDNRTQKQIPMGDSFDQNIQQAAFRLELVKDASGAEKLLWHGLVDGQPQTLDVEPYTGFWRRFGISFMSILPIESQL